MDFAKFVALVSRQELYLCNLEVLAEGDPHEGLLAYPNYRHRHWKTADDLTEEERKIVFYEPTEGEQRRIQFESHKNAREYWARRRRYDRRTLFVNCWHENKFESAAMWAQYAAGGQGIAITSSYQRLTEALATTQRRLFFGQVKYLDWTKQPVDNTLMFPLSKRASFEHEREWRLIYWDLETQAPINALCEKLTTHTMDHLFRRIGGTINWEMIERDAEAVPFQKGLYVKVDLERLIDEIYVSPTSPQWVLDAVAAVCEKFDLAPNPRRSDILSAPLS
jgi:hypothetical protein